MSTANAIMTKLVRREVLQRLRRSPADALAEWSEVLEGATNEER